MGIFGIEEDRSLMGQRIAKHQMQTGVKLYHQRRHQQAIARWNAALRRLNNAEDRFITLGYMAQAYCDAGDYQTMLQYSLRQMELANTRQDECMKSEAFLNLSKAYERLADFSLAIGYGRASLQHRSMDPRTPVVALAHLGFSQFQESLQAFEKAMSIANHTSDRLLELQVCVGLGALFTLLRDLDKAVIFLRNALAILQGVSVDDVHAKYRSIVLYHMSVVLRKKGSLADAKAACDEAMQLASETGNSSVYARCLCSLADICRELGESEAKETLTKSWARYEEAYRIMRRTNDRMGVVLVLGSMAKSASETRSHYTGQCECQAIQLNKKCLEVAKTIGCKHAMLKCHLRLQDLYSQLNDEDSEEVARQTIISLTQEMELFCNFCGQRFGLHKESLQALRCSHIFHERCLQIHLRERIDSNCPKCECKAIVMDSISFGTPSISSSAMIDSLQPLMNAEEMPSSNVQLKKPTGDIPLFASKSLGPYVSRKAAIVRLQRPIFDQNVAKIPNVIDQSQQAGLTSGFFGSRSPLTKGYIESGSSIAGCTGSSSKPAPPMRKPSCKMDGNLSINSVLNYSEEELRAGGPLVLPRGLTVTDV